MFVPTSLPRRFEVALALILGGVTVVAWILTIRLMGLTMPAESMAGPMGAGVTATVDVAMWVAMMAAMMLPSTAPVLVAVTRIARSRKPLGAAAPVPAAFAVGYLLVWMAVGLVAAGLDLGGRAVWDATPTLAAIAPRAAGAILVLAGLYQVGPLKNRCLAQCRSPFGFLLTHWREGMVGAVVLGARHGGFCLGCCWALMATLLVTSTLGVVWPLTLSCLILVEKALPSNRFVTPITAVGFVALGAAQLVGLMTLGM